MTGRTCGACWGRLREIEIWSVAVPVANILFPAVDWLLRRSDETKKAGLSRRADRNQRLARDSWKTMFPRWVKLVLNRYMLYPLSAFQRLFYRSDLGITMLGFGSVTRRWNVQ